MNKISIGAFAATFAVLSIASSQAAGRIIHVIGASPTAQIARHINLPAAAFGNLPTAFERNLGQTDASVKFLARGRNSVLFLTGTDAVLRLSRPVTSKSRANGLSPRPDRSVEWAHSSVLKMRVVGGTHSPQVIGLDELPGKVNYFIGSAHRNWRANIATYRDVSYRNIYKNIDLVYYGSGDRLEYDFVCRPGGDPSKIALSFSGARSMRITSNGDLLLSISGGDITWRKPVVYQTSADGVRRPIQGGYVLANGGAVRFAVAAHDASRPLIIDPVLDYGTYLGGTGDDFCSGITTDSSGNAYVVGMTLSSDFPVTAGAAQTTFGGDNPADQGGDIFVAKLSADGSQLLYATYIGGSDGDWGNGIAVDSSGSAYIGGWSYSTDFPIVGGLGETLQAGYLKAVIAKLNPTGSALVYSTYLGGSYYNQAYDIAIDSAGEAYAVGWTDCSDFPVTAGAAQYGSYGGGFISKLSADGSRLVYSTYLGGSGGDWTGKIAVDGAGNAYVTGGTASPDFPTTPGVVQSAFPGGDCAGIAAKLSADGSTLLYSTFLGGSVDDAGYGIAVDASGNAFVTGQTSSPDFPTTTGAFQSAYAGSDNDGNGGDAFISELNPSATSLVYSTYLGGAGDDWGWDIAIDGSDDAYVTGATTSTDFPDAGSGVGTNQSSVFLSELDPFGSSLIYSTYMGGSGQFEGAFGASIALDAADDAYICGYSNSANFASAGAFQSTNAGGYDGFVAKVAALTPSVTTGGSLSPGTTQALNVGGKLAFTATPGTYHALTGWRVDSSTIAGHADARALSTSPTTVKLADGTLVVVSGSTLTFSNVQGSHTVSAVFTGYPGMKSLVLSAYSGPGGVQYTGMAELLGPTPGAGAVTIASSNPSLISIPNQAIATGGNAVSFKWSPAVATTPTKVILTAAYAGTTTTANFTINISVVSVTVSPSSGVNGSRVAAKVTLSGKAPNGGIPVTLTSSDPSVINLPSSVTVLANASTATFNFTSASVSSATPVTITATYKGSVQSTTYTVEP